MLEDVQKEVAKLWHMVDSDNLKELTDIKGVRGEFLQHHGYEMPGIDNDQDVRPDIFRFSLKIQKCILHFEKKTC